MIKLFGFPGTRSSRVQWLLEEAEAPYELVVLDVMKGGHKQPEHLARHPHGLVPAFEDGDVRLIESAAMCMYVAEAYPQKKLAPADAKARAKYFELIVYAVSTLDESVIPVYLQEKFVPADKRDPKIIEKGKATFAVSATFLERELGKGPFMLGETFTAADVAVGYDLALAAQLNLLADHPTLQQYVGRLVERPAFAKAFPKR